MEPEDDLSIKPTIQIILNIIFSYFIVLMISVYDLIVCEGVHLVPTQCITVLEKLWKFVCTWEFTTIKDHTSSNFETDPIT